METKMMRTKYFFKLASLFPAAVRVTPDVVGRMKWYAQMWAYPTVVLLILLSPITYTVGFFTWLGIDLWHLITKAEYDESFCEFYETMKELNCGTFLEWYRMVMED